MSTQFTNITGDLLNYMGSASGAVWFAALEIPGSSFGNGKGDNCGKQSFLNSVMNSTC